MSSLHKGNGQVTATTQFVLLNPVDIFDATSFYYDFYLEGADSSAVGVWQIEDGGYADMPGATGVSGAGDVELLSSIEIDATSTGLVQIERTTGTLNYWYTISGGGGFPTVRGAAGSSSTDVEFFLEKGRVYSVVSNGTHSWKYWDGSAWAVITGGTTNNFSFEAPATGRIQLDVTGAVAFTITSRKA